MPRNALGRGLGALIREPEPAQPVPAIEQPAATSISSGPAAAAAAPAREAMHGPQEIDIDLVEPSPYQPRTRFREEALEELSRSIRASGIIQPIVVRPVGNRYQLIAGERRWRAAQRAGLRRVAAIVRQVADELALEMTLVENIQREDLNAMEAARAFDRLMDKFQMTQEAVAERTGKDRATVANAIRLLKLEPTIQDWIEEGKLSAGHGRALLAVLDPQLRMRFAQRAGLRRVAAIVRQVTDELALEMTLVENIQREDLNAMEAARAFDRLMDEFQMTQEAVAERTGKDRATVANAIRLLKLEPTIQDWIEEGKLSAGHGRALLAVLDPQLRMRFAQRASRGGLTVRQIERLASRRARGHKEKAEAQVDPNVREALDELQRHLGTKIFLRERTKIRPGQLVLEFYDDHQLMGLYDRLMK